MTDHETARVLGELKTELHSTNKTIERIAASIERSINDHESRLRQLESEQLKASGVIRLIAWLGAPSFAAILFFLVKGGK